MKKLLILTLVFVAIFAISIPVFGNGMVHKVVVGGPDICEGFFQRPGCDKNFSLHALEFADGTVQGEYTDMFSGGNGGFHATIDCLSVYYNLAWVGGVVTTSTDTTGFYPVGMRVVVLVADNGTTANDPADMISFSAPEALYGGCDTQPWELYELLFDAPQGMVIVE